MLELELISATDGDFFIIKNDTIISQCLRGYGRWEKQLLEYLEPLIKPDFTIIDAGANIGTHTVYFAKRCISVYSFEIVPELAEIAEKNRILNSCWNAVIYNRGLSDKNTMVNIPTSLSNDKPFNYGGISLNMLLSMESETKQVQVMTIDMMQLDRLDLIKIDVEEMEPEVVKGAIETIKRCKPIVVFEAFPRTKRIMFELMNEIGYTNIVCPTDNPVDFVARP